MSNFDAVEDIFEVDTNRDGVIDKKELCDRMSRDEQWTSSPYESSTYGCDRKVNTRSRRDRYGYREPTGRTSSLINLSGPEETRRYLERSGSNIYMVPDPKIIRRSSPERGVTYAQRVVIQCLQPPPLPPPEPLIIKEVRPAQPPPPEPLVICERPSGGTTPPPLILRERPPIPPPRISGGTIIRPLPPIPVPPRSLIIKRFPSAPAKPRDIIIERWAPYGPQPKRPEIVQPAPPPIKYPAPFHHVIIYDNVQSKVVRKFERPGFIQEDPEMYLARYGPSLLDPLTLEQQARNAGVTEDISCASFPCQPRYPSPREEFPKCCCCGCNDAFSGIARHTRFGYNVYDPSDISAKI
ncbi:unnamed protein product [Rotaria sp. Silwood1]|nr:unnamed protein product [Rotaria sp. Silwood1]CAF1513909.1 unnamed protein product [Rotaria sp. Silwood1]